MIPETKTVNGLSSNADLLKLQQSAHKYYFKLHWYTFYLQDKFLQRYGKAKCNAEQYVLRIIQPVEWTVMYQIQ